MGFEKVSRPVIARRVRTTKVAESTAAETLGPGTYALVTAQTSSGAPEIWTLAQPKSGDVVDLVAKTVPSSSVAPIHINASDAVFGYSSSGTGHDMVTLSTNGAGFRAVALNSSEWLVTAIRSATFSTST